MRVHCRFGISFDSNQFSQVYTLLFFTKFSKTRPQARIVLNFILCKTIDPLSSRLKNLVSLVIL